MEQITIRIQNRDKAELLLRILRSLDFVDSIESVSNGDPIGESTESQERNERFMALAGLWKDQEITIGSLRARAWPRQPS